MNAKKHASLHAAVLVGLVCVVGLAAPPGAYGEQVILWNTLGSDEEVLSSAYGPNLEFYTNGSWPDVQGDCAYVPGVFGNAATLTGGPYGVCDRIHNIVLDNLPSYFNPEHGTVEVWYMQTADPVEYDHNPHRVFGGSYGLGSGMGFQSAVTYGEGRFHFGLGFGGTGTSVYSHDDGVVGHNISEYNGTWIHLAGVWDRAGIEGTADTMHLYLDGQVVASTTQDTWGTAVGQRVDICGGNDHNILGKFYVDNLILWDCAKTDFSHRFFESPFALPQVDIKPGSCPNSFNRASHGVLPVALVGTVGFDVTAIDISTVELYRADGIGGSVAPHEGPPGPHSEYEDVATPFMCDPCDCLELPRPVDEVQDRRCGGQSPAQRAGPRRAGGAGGLGESAGRHDLLGQRLPPAGSAGYAARDGGRAVQRRRGLDRRQPLGPAVGRRRFRRLRAHLSAGQRGYSHRRTDA